MRRNKLENKKETKNNISEVIRILCEGYEKIMEVEQPHTLPYKIAEKSIEEVIKVCDSFVKK